jgi:hypothetical protein
MDTPTTWQIIPATANLRLILLCMVRALQFKSPDVRLSANEGPSSGSSKSAASSSSVFFAGPQQEPQTFGFHTWMSLDLDITTPHDLQILGFKSLML